MKNLNTTPTSKTKHPIISLSQIRHFLLNNLSFQIKSHSISIGTESYHPSDLTNFRSKSNLGNFYSIAEIAYFTIAKKQNLNHAIYLANARKMKIGFVKIGDKEELANYLERKIEDSDCVEVHSLKKKGFEYKEERKLNLVYDYQNTEKTEIRTSFSPFFSVSKSKNQRNGYCDFFLNDYKCLNYSNDEIIENNFLSSKNEKKISQTFEKIFKSSFEAINEKKSKVASLSPIIIVPSVPTLPLNVNTVLSVLGSAVFKSESKLSLNLINEKLINEKLVNEQKLKIKKHSRLKKNFNVFFKVRETLKGMKREERERIVCVFVVGEEWQFDGWEIDSDSYFLENLGICVLYSGEAEKVRWCKNKGIKVIEIEKENREKDKKNYALIWEYIYDWLKRRDDKKIAY